jgi:hypothetical protein
MPAGLDIVSLAIGLSQVVTGALLLAHFKKQGFRPIWRISAILVMLCGFFVAFGEFVYQLGRHSR